MSYKLSLMKDGEGTLQNGLPLLNTVMPGWGPSSALLHSSPGSAPKGRGAGGRIGPQEGRHCREEMFPPFLSSLIAAAPPRGPRVVLLRSCLPVPAVSGLINQPASPWQQEALLCQLLLNRTKPAFISERCCGLG